MAPYHYDRSVNPYVPSIAELLAHEGDIRGQAAVRVGDAQAAAQAASGHIWGQAVQTLGQIPQQMQQQRHEATINALNDLKLQEARREQAGQHAVAGMMASTDQLPPGDAGPRQESYLDQNGLFDIQKITQSLGSSGYGDIAPQLVKGAESINDSVLRRKELDSKVAEQHAIMLGDMASGVQNLRKIGFPIESAMDFVVQPGLASNLIDPKEYAQIRSQFMAMSPEQQDSGLKSLMDQAAKFDKGTTLAEGAQHVDRYGRVTATGAPKPKNEAELAADAATLGTPHETPSAKDSARAMGLLKPPQKATAEQDDARYRQIIADRQLGRPIADADTAWAKGYETQKKLTVDASAGAAADRQAKAIDAQTAEQKRAQDFQIAQAGRKELTDNVVRPFQQAQTSAQELRDFVHAAQSGNKEAANLQALQATMSTIRANGLNRLNQAEMKLPANAGSLWDRVQGKVGSVVSGQPIDGALQKDMLELADLLEKGAYNKYLSGHKDITTRYGLKDEKPLAPPVSSSSAPPIKVGGFSVVVKP